MHRITQALAVVVLVATVSGLGVLHADPIAPNIVALDFNFSWSSVNYLASTETLAGVGQYAVTSFEPTIGGVAYPVYNVDGNPGATLALAALFDTLGTNAEVDGLFMSAGGLLPDLVVTGNIPDLGIAGGLGVNLLEAEIVSLELFGNEGTGAFALNGTFRVTGGALMSEGYVGEGDELAMRSWLTNVFPALPEDFAFDSNFAASTHLGQLGTVPEPATMGLIALGLGALGVLRRKRR